MVKGSDEKELDTAALEQLLLRTIVAWNLKKAIIVTTSLRLRREKTRIMWREHSGIKMLTTLAQLSKTDRMMWNTIAINRTRTQVFIILHPLLRLWLPPSLSQT